MSNQLIVGTLIDHDRYGEGVVGKINPVSYEIYFAHGGKIEILKSNKDYKIISSPGDSSASGGANIDIEGIEKMITHVLDKYGLVQEIVPLGEKWTGGKMILQPSNASLQSKDIPIEVFFHKIVMLRDRLRVLEQNINSNQKLSDEEKVDFQQYITRIYGTLTTFNILFRDKDHYFVGAGK